MGGVRAHSLNEEEVVCDTGVCEKTVLAIKVAQKKISWWWWSWY